MDATQQPVGSQPVVPQPVVPQPVVQQLQANTPPPIDRMAPDYTLQLLRLCAERHLCDGETLLRIQAMLQEAFYAQAHWFAHGESSTISKSQATALYESVLYQVDAALCTLPTDADAIACLTTRPIADLVAQGRDRILELFAEAQERFRAAFACRLHLPMQSYQSMLHVQFDAFCQNYSARFDAKNATIEIDYPLLGKPAYALKTEGIVLVHQYYTQILYENQFCSYFSIGNIQALLIRYGKRYRLSYQEMSVNIAELVCNNWFAALLLGHTEFSTILPPQEIRELQSTLALSAPQAVIAHLTNSLHSMPIPHPEVSKLLLDYVPQYAATLVTQAANHTLSNFLVAIY